MAFKVELTHHAREKIKLLQELGFPVSEEQVVQTVPHPDRVESGRRGERIAQRRIGDRHVLRVAYVQQGEKVRIITVYPGRRERYEREK